MRSVNSSGRKCLCVRSFFLWLTFFTAGCATQYRDLDNTVALPENISFVLLAPKDAGRSIRALQKIQGSYREKQFVMLAYLDVDVDNDFLSLAATTVSGATIFSLSVNNGVLDVVRSPLAPSSVEAKQVLAHLQLIYWPLAVLSDRLNQQTVRFEYDASSYSRRLLKDGRDVIVIDYDAADVWQSIVDYQNFAWGYRYRVETIEIAES